MSEIKLGIIGGGQLGKHALSSSKKKLNIKTTIYSDDNECACAEFQR
jgi:phosphoribosylaminoimidazole carboxylase (NCAIR synthetase)